MKPKLLFLSQSLPYPPDGGVQIRTYNVLRILSEHFSIHLLCFYRSAVARDVAHSVKELRSIVDSIDVFPIPQEQSKARLVLDHLSSLCTRRPYTYWAHRSPAFANAVDQLLKKYRFDLVHFDSLDLSYYLKVVKDVPVACTHHNVESELLRRRSHVEKNTLRRSYFRIQSQLLKQEEARHCGRMAVNLVCSEADSEALKSIAPDASILVVPNGVDTAQYRPAKPQQHGIVFVGGLTWYPNHDALEFFISDIQPMLRKGGGDPHVTWVGRATAEQRSRYQEFGVSLTGYVDSIAPFVERAKCFVVPLRIGGGTRLKVLNAWAMGKAIVSTSVGCEGLGAIDGYNILVRDTPEDFANAVEEVLKNDKLREHLERNARETAVSRFDWRVIGGRLIDCYSRLASKSG